MHSTVIEGKVLDWRFAHMPNNNGYHFYIGNILIGSVFQMGHSKRSWTAVSMKNPHPLCPLHGFRTKLDAAECLLKMNGYQ